MIRVSMALMALVVASVVFQPLAAQDQAGPSSPGGAGSAGKPPPSGPAAPPSGQEVVEDLLRKRQDPVIRPNPPATAPTLPGAALTPGPSIDPRVQGVAPDGQKAKLKAEGEFVVNRRGRLVRAADGAHFLFVFEADSAAAPETPVILMPCQLLESMEKLVQERGQSLSFRITGQLFLYKGANYLLPSVMRIATDKLNLQK
jgi:hypothetical protein